MTQHTPWKRRLSTKLTIIAVVLFGVSGAIGGANLWAFHQLEHDTALEMLGCAGRDRGDHCRELGRAHLDRLHQLQYALMALSVFACSLVTWLALEIQTRVRALTVLSERLERGEPTEPVSGRDDLAAVGRSIGSTVRRLERQRATEQEALGERIDTLLSLNRALAEGAGGTLPTSFQSSGRFAVAPASPDEPPALGRVLLVDDEPEVLRGFARVLKARGHHVSTASQAAEAITKLSEGRFDVVVSDISMPGMDGIQLLREVRRRDLTVPVILATGRPAVKSAAEAVESGAFQYLIKPIQNENLCQVVEHGVRVSRMGRVKDEAAELLGHNAALGADRAGLEVTFDRTLQSLWMAFQPIVDVKARTLYAFESLLRSNEPALPHPGAVLDAAERLGRLDALGRVVRAKAAAEFAAAPELPRLFVNLHVRDLLDPDLLDPDAALSKLAKRVVLEITERASLEDVRDARLRVAALREMGFRIAVDDMGAGYAGLSSFALLEPEVVKLDMSLIRDIHRNAIKRKVVRSMIELSKGMGIEVIAEGIETSDERDTLVELGCDLLQGYLFAKPGRPFPNVDWGDLSPLRADVARSRASAI
jgi:EAL domain-containing protein (putative c-di-GMP-specific phosphodiesterase class I)/ActR/RegA family two-component response regulator